MVTHRERIDLIEKECSGVWGQTGVTSWERERLAEWKQRPALTEKQEEILQGIEQKVFGGCDE